MGIFAGLCLRLEDWPIYALSDGKNKPVDQRLAVDPVWWLLKKINR